MTRGRPMVAREDNVHYVYVCVKGEPASKEG